MNRGRDEQIRVPHSPYRTRLRRQGDRSRRDCAPSRPPAAAVVRLGWAGVNGVGRAIVSQMPTHS